MKNFRQLTEFRLFFWHLVNKYVTDAWQVDAEEVTLNEEFSVLIKHKVEEIILHLMEESFREGIYTTVSIRKPQSWVLEYVYAAKKM